MTDTNTSLFGLDAEGRQLVPVNVYETTDALVVVAPMPGVRAEDVTVTLQPGEVVLRADLRTAAVKDYLMHEWDYGAYERHVPLPDGFGGPITATLGQGQLAVSIARGPDDGVHEVRPTEAGTG